MIEEPGSRLLLSRLSPEQVERVGRHPLRVKLDEGRWLFGQGDPAERFYLVRKGQIRLSMAQSAETLLHRRRR